MNKELLHTYFSGESNQEEEAQIMNWAEASPENHRQYLEERKLWNAMLIHYTKKDTAPSVQSNHIQLNIWKVISVAATVATLIAMSWIYIHDFRVDRKMQAVIVPAGQRVQLVLEDGTRVWLNSKSKLTYPASFGNDTREVTLDGEGFFEVTRNEEKPFIVKTHKYDVKVLGTTFNVYAYNTKSSSFETSLLHGSVDVISTENSNSHVLLKPHEKVTEENGILQKSTIDNLDRYRWKDGLICLDDEPFEDLMKKFSVYYDIHIKIENPTVRDYRCTGKFRQSDGVEYALKVIQKDLKFSYTRDDESNTIVIH